MNKTMDVCTASLALALALQPWHITSAKSHCAGLAEAVCGTTAACKWQQAANAGDTTKAGTPRKNSMKAHCRLDVAQASKLASEITSKR